MRTSAASARMSSGRSRLWRATWPAHTCSNCATSRAIADGQPLPVVAREQIDRNNAAGGERFVDADRGETLEILRRDGETAARFVAGLTDEQLQQVGAYVDWVPAMSVEKWIEHVLIGHIRGHLTSMRAVVEQTALPS